MSINTFIYIMRIAICIIYVHDDVDVYVNGCVNVYADGCSNISIERYMIMTIVIVYVYMHEPETEN